MRVCMFILPPMYIALATYNCRHHKESARYQVNELVKHRYHQVPDRLNIHVNQHQHNGSVAGSTHTELDILYVAVFVLTMLHLRCSQTRSCVVYNIKTEPSGK